MNASPIPIAPAPTLAERRPRSIAGALLLLTAGVVVAAWFLPAGTNWLIALSLIVVFFLLTGKAITGRGLGILINERKLMSLSRLQLVIWTIVIVSGFFVIALERIRMGEAPQPLNIGVDWQIWALLGLSATSFVGTPLLYGAKKAKNPADPELVPKVAARYREEPSGVNANREGILYGNGSIQDARFTDMFEGDELANVQLVDVAKLQMFFFTVAIAVAYGMQLYALIAYGDLSVGDVKMPEVQSGLLVLMGVSHAGYLGSKSVDRTKTA
ncbi:MAG TPA: hypothetical protein VHW95_09995 [Steroidobacteraceae bacterium]|jgi:hypothetical protein|nr:hypothetical protein [Steroidobacteraceae bacterium]